jgi:hypothetical protein
MLVPGAAGAVTTGHTGSGRPAITFSGSRMYVAWAGSSGAAATRQLVIGFSTDGGTTITKVSNSESTPQAEGPAVDGDGTGAYVAWAAGNNANTLTAAYTNGSSLTCKSSFTGIVAAHAPAMAHDPSGVRYLTWADPAGHLNVARLNSGTCPMTLTNRVTLPDTTVAAPSIVYDSSGSSNLGLLLAWTSGDAVHSIRTATFDGTTTLTNRSQVSTPVGSTDAPGISSADADLYLTFRGTDGQVYLAYSEGCQPTCFTDHASTLGEQATGGVGQPQINNGVWYTFFDTTGHLVISS